MVCRCAIVLLLLLLLLLRRPVWPSLFLPLSEPLPPPLEPLAKSFVLVADAIDLVGPGLVEPALP
jgi:hypothetical protein